MNKPTSIAVIGGGIAGLATAFYLKKAGANVTLWDKGADPLRGSAAAVGQVVLKGLHESRSALFYAKILGAQALRTLKDEVEKASGQHIPFLEGVWEPYYSPEDCKKSTERVFRREAPPPLVTLPVPMEEYFFAKRWYANDYWLDPRALLSGLETALRRHGVFGEHCQVQKIGISPDKSKGIQITAEGGKCESYTDVVIACGTHTIPLLGEILGRSLSQKIVYGESYDFKAAPSFKKEAPFQLTHGKSALVWQGETITVGSTSHSGEEKSSSHKCAENDQGFAFACEEFPFLLDLKRNGGEFSLAERRSGGRVLLPDRLPLVGRVEGISEHLYVCSGLYKNGFQLAPLCGRYLADLIMNAGQAEAKKWAFFEAFLPKNKGLG